MPVKDEKITLLQPIVAEQIHREATLPTEMAVASGRICKNPDFRGHRMISHIQTYGLGESHANTIENAFSLLNSGVYGTCHQVSTKHLGRYCNEFSYRFSRPGEQLQMFDRTRKNLTRGKALQYKRLSEKQING